MEERKQAMLKKLADRNSQRILKVAANPSQLNIDLSATEKAFLSSSPSSVNMKTPLNPTLKAPTVVESASPILSFDEKADKQMVALATWCNTMIGMEASEEMDLGETKAEAIKRIQSMLSKKSDGEAENTQQQARRRYHRIFEKNDPTKIKKQCQKLLEESGIDESIRDLLSKKTISIRNELSVYSDLGQQTSLLRIFLSFHPAWLKAALEAIFDMNFNTPPKYLVGAISRFFIDHVFSNKAMLRNKKFAQGSGKPIVTPEGKEALHRHFLLNSMKLMFLIETAYSHRVIPNLTRIFTKSSVFKSLDDMFSELTKDLLSGSSASLKRAFAKIGFTPSYKQSFIENHDYQAKGFGDFNDGLILAKLVETVGELPHGKLLLKLRDPSGDRIRKVNNVKTVLSEMTTMGIATENVDPDSIVRGKKEAILAILWAIIGVRVAKEKRICLSRAPSFDENSSTKKRRSGVHDEMSSEILKTCKIYGRELDVEVLDLETMANGVLLSKAWNVYVPSAAPVQTFEGNTLWEKVVTMAEEELRIPRGLDQNVALFVKTFLERMQEVRNSNEKAAIIQKAWRSYAFRKKTPKLYSVVQQLLGQLRSLPDRSYSPNFSIGNATFTVNRTSTFSGRQSCESTLNDATFTVSRESVESINFKIPKTPSRVTFSRTTLVSCFNEVIEEDENEENEETIGRNMTDEREQSVEEKENSPDRTLEKMPEDVEHEDGYDDQKFNEEESNEIQKDDTEKTESFPSEKVEEDMLVETTEAVQQRKRSISFDEIQKEDADKEPEEKVPLPMEVDEMAKETTSLDSDQNGKESQEDVARVEKEKDLRSETTTTTTEEVSSDEYTMTAKEMSMQELLNKMVEDQKKFVEKNHLDVQIVVGNENATTPELRRILRETKILKKKQEAVTFQAKRLGQIERQALAARKQEAEQTHVQWTTVSEDLEDRSDAGHDEAMIHVEDLLEEDAARKDEARMTAEKEAAEKEAAALMRNTAASVIQKTIRGFLARRRLRNEIENMRERVTVYNQGLAREDEQFVRDTSTDTSMATSSVQTKLRNCSLNGLTDANLHIVHLAATIIDRLTDLVPSLLESFVCELNGVKLVYDILEVADRGYSYTSILQPLLKILRKSFENVPAEKTNDTILPLLSKLSPRLSQLMLAHCANKDFFTAITTSLISIGRRFPTKKQSYMEKSSYFVTKASTKVTDPECKKLLMTLKNICNTLI